MTDFLSRAELADDRLAAQIAEGITKEVPGRVIVDEPLFKHTSFRIGGPARFYVYPASTDALCSLVQFCRAKKLRLFTIGFGTNLLVADEGFAGCVADLNEGARTLEIKDTLLTAGGGVWLGEVVRTAAERGLAGMEKLAGIPGGIGGGLSMNAGAFGMSISDHLFELEAVTEVGETVVMSKSDVAFGYRSAPGLAGKSVTKALFQLPRGRKSELVRVVEETIAERYRRRVMTLPSAGSVFKNPSGGFAAKMIESIGGKGMTEGGVGVSPHHANFIVNERDGCAADVIRLIRRLRRLVREEYGVALELEVRRLGFEEEPDLG